jgi:hypothetical protein
LAIKKNDLPLSQNEFEMTNKVWKINDHYFLIKGNAFDLYCNKGIINPEGNNRFHSSYEYLKVNHLGEIVERYKEPHECTLDSHLYVTNAHLVINDTLFCFFYDEDCWTPYYEVTKGEIIIENLIIYLEDTLPFDIKMIIENKH